MKRKLLIVALLLIVAISSVLLAACDKSDTADKASNNKQFVSFRKKIVTILKDNDIFVNDLDNTASKTPSRANIVKTAAPLYSDGNVADIYNILVKDEFAAEDGDYEFGLKQVYAIALQMSLCIGDGLINYFGEKEIYNIPVYIPCLNMVITEQDNKISVYSYQLVDYDGKQYEDLMKIDIVFNSETDYYFTVTETGGDWIVSSERNDTYFYGNSQKQFLMLRAGYEAVYSPNGQDFYETSDGKVVAECEGAVGDVFSLNAAEYRKIESNVMHRFTQEQYQTLNDKYFKDVQSSSQPRESEFIYDEIGGKHVLMNYIAANGETEVVIPSDVKYISERFCVEDMQNSVKSLVIPASIEKIINVDDGSELKDFSCVRFELMAQEGKKLFQNITVKQGSKLFKAGQGHLTMNDGYVLYAVDKALTDLDIDVLTRAVMQERDGYKYKNLYKITSSEVTIDSSRIDTVVERYKCSLENLLDLLMKIFNNSSIDTYNINIYVKAYNDYEDPNAGGYGGLNMTLNLKSDVTINVNFGECGKNDMESLNVVLVNSSSTKRNVAVNVKGFSYLTDLNVGPKQPETEKDGENYVSNDKIFTTFNLDVPEFYYEGLCNGRLQRDEKNSTVNFDEKISEQYRNIAIGNAEVSGAGASFTCTLYITNDVRDGDVIAIPSQLFGLSIQQIYVDADAVADKSVTVNLPDFGDMFDKVEFYSSSNEQSVTFNNPNFVISGNCEWDLLKSRIANYDSNANFDISFTLQGSDRTELVQTGWKYGDGNPDNEVHQARFWLDEQDFSVSYSRRQGVEILEQCEQGYAYFAYTRKYTYGWQGEGQINILNLYRNEQGQLSCAYDEIDRDFGKDDNDFILVKHAIGTANLTVRGDRLGVMDTEFEVVFDKKVVDGKTYFTAKIIDGQLSDSEKRYIVYDNAVGISLFEYVDCNFTRSDYDYDYETEQEILIRSELGCSGLMFLCAQSEIVILRDYTYVDKNITAHIGGEIFSKTVRVNEDEQYIKFNVDDWGLKDVDNYAYFVINNSVDLSAQTRKEIAIVREGGSVYAIWQDRLLYDFILEKYKLGASEETYNDGKSYSLKISMNIAKPLITTAEDGGLVIEFYQSSFAVGGEVEGRPVRGFGNIPYYCEIEYLDADYEYCDHFWDCSNGYHFYLWDKYATVQIIVGDKTYEKRAVVGRKMTIDPQWLNLEEGYAYFLQADGKELHAFEYDDQGRIRYYFSGDDQFNPLISSLRLVRIAYGEHSYHLHDDDGQGNSYDLDITFTVSIDNDYAIPYDKIVVTASGVYNGSPIQGASDNASINYASFIMPDGAHTSSRRWLYEFDGLDIKIIGIGEYV